MMDNLYLVAIGVRKITRASTVAMGLWGIVKLDSIGQQVFRPRVHISRVTNK